MKYLFLLILLCMSPAYALTVDAPLPDATQEARAQMLFRDLRCVVCQSEAIADSPAEVARDMRRVVREKISGGMSDTEIKSMLVTQYGERVLMSPPVANHLLLWLAPLLLLLTGAIFAWRTLFRGATE